MFIVDNMDFRMRRWSQDMVRYHHPKPNKNTIMKSFAIYYKVNKDFKDEELSDSQAFDRSIKSKYLEKYADVGELHMNIWKVNQGGVRLHSVFYVDLGVKVSFKCESIRIYVPFKTKAVQQADLCKIIMENRELLCAVFNDEMLPEPQLNTCFCKVMNQTDGRKFYLYQLGSGNIKYEAYCIGNTQVGTYITLTLNGNPKNADDLNEFKDNQRYVRIRLCVEEKEKFAITEHISNDLIQAAFSRTDLFDIRINEKREIDGKILERMKTDEYKQLLFDKVHVFYIADTREDVENESSLKIDSRLLEKNHWLTYEPKNDLRNTHFVAHHWRKRRKEDKDLISDASVFFSTKYPSLDGWRLTSYFAAVVILGWLGSMLSFKFSEIGFTSGQWMSWIRPAVIFVLLCIIVGLTAKINLGFESLKIFRKR